MNRMEETRALREDTQVHYNCCQSILVPFCRECGLSREEAYRLGAHFGGGMKHGATCGAVTGALMVLGMSGLDNEAALELMSRFRRKNLALNCAELLAMAEARGEERKPNCDRIVYDAVEILEDLLAARGQG